MKKYRLKEEAKEKLKSFLGTIELNYEMPLSDWHNKFKVFSEQFFTCELEEVEEKIELELCNIGTATNTRLQKKKLNGFTEQEKELCEKALNGELLDVNSLDDADFGHWYYNNDNDNVNVTVDTTDYAYSIRGIKAVLKQYLKEKK
jgi:hypothetical protein